MHHDRQLSRDPLSPTHAEVTAPASPQGTWILRPEGGSQTAGAKCPFPAVRGDSYGTAHGQAVDGWKGPRRTRTVAGGCSLHRGLGRLGLSGPLPLVRLARNG